MIHPSKTKLTITPVILDPRFNRFTGPQNICHNVKFNHNISDISIVTQRNFRLHELAEALRDKPNKAYKEISSYEDVLCARHALLSPRGVGRLRDEPNKARKHSHTQTFSGLVTQSPPPPPAWGRRLRDEPKKRLSRRPIRKLHLGYPPTSSFTWVNKSPGLRPDSNAALPWSTF